MRIPAKAGIHKACKHSTRETLSELLNGRAGVSPEMALRLAKAFDTTPESWLGRPMEYDLWQTEKRAKRLQVKRLAA